MTTLPLKPVGCDASTALSRPRRYGKVPVSPMGRNNKPSSVRKQATRHPLTASPSHRLVPPPPLFRVQHKELYPDSSFNTGQPLELREVPRLLPALDVGLNPPTTEDRCHPVPDPAPKPVPHRPPAQVQAPKAKSDVPLRPAGLHYGVSMPMKAIVPAPTLMGNTTPTAQTVTSNAQTPKPSSAPPPPPTSLLSSYHPTKSLSASPPAQDPVAKSIAPVSTEPLNQLSATWGRDLEELRDTLLPNMKPPTLCLSSNSSTDGVLDPLNVVLCPQNLTAKPGVNSIPPRSSKQPKKSSPLGQAVTGADGKTLRIVGSPISRAPRSKPLYVDFYKSCGCTDGGREECVSCRILKKADEFCIKVDNQCTEMQLFR